MTPRTLTLSTGRTVSRAAYLATWRMARSLPADMVIDRTMDGVRIPHRIEQLREYFRDALFERINGHLPWWGRGRKWAPEWQATTARCSFTLNMPGRSIDWLPAHLMGRFGHRLRDWGDWA